MQKNKKLGFTLIELLAVIVILALIALITVPIIGNVVESSRKESIKISSDNYIRILEEKAQINLIDEDLKSKRIEVGENGKYIYNGEENTLDIKGKIPTSGTVCVDSNGKVDSYSVVIDDYVASNTNGTVKIEKGNTKLSLTCDVTKEIIEIEIPEDNLVCSKSKNISIKYPNYVETVKEYKIDDGDWQVYNGKFEIKKNGVIYARLRDTRNNEVSGTATLVLTKVDNDKVDKTAPRLNLSPENPTKEIVATFLQKDNCGLDEKTIEYAISESESGPFTYQKSNTFKKLKNNTTYYIRTRANDIAGNGISESEVSSIKTEDFKDIVIQTDPVSWSSSKIVKITGETKGATLEYKMVSASTIKTDWSTIKSGFTTKIDWAANVNIPTYIYARQTDGDNISNTATYTVVTNDITEPELILGNSYITTKSIKIPITLNRDLESGIDNTTCKYGENTNYSYSGNIVNNECVISNLKSGTKYYYRVETINKAGLNKVVTGDTDTGSSSIKIDLVSYPDNTTYAQYKTAKVKFSQEKITNPSYYIKTTVATTGSINGISCGTGNDPSTCQGTSTTNYAANTWYKVNSNTDVKFTSNGTLYTRINDGEIYSSAETITITKIDTTPPILATGDIYKTTSHASLPFTAGDAESDIARVVCSYGKNNNNETTGTIKNDKCEMSNLVSGTKYYYKIIATNNSGLTKELTGNFTSGSTQILFTLTNSPSNTEYAQYKSVKVTFSAKEVTTPTYYIKTTVATTGSIEGISCGTNTDPGTCSKTATKNYNANTWYKVTSNPDIKFISNGTLYARIDDGKIYSSAETMTITKIDTTPPLVTLGNLIKTTKTIKIPFTASDSESGIISTVCKYGTSTSYGKDGEISNNTCIITGNANTKYYYSITTTNGSGLTTTKTGDTISGSTAISLSLTQYPTTTEYAQYKNVQVTFSTKEVTTPTYYVKATVNVSGSVTGIPCGTNTEPGTCKETSTTSYAANTWYKVNSNTNIKFTSNGTLYARVNDGESYSSSETLTITKIDTTSPTLTLGNLEKTTKTVKIPFTASDSESGIGSTTCKYGTSTSYDKDGEIKNNKCEMKSLTSNTTYYYKVVTTNKAGLTKTVTGDTVSGSTAISLSLTQYPTSTEYAQYKVVKAKFTSNNVTTPTYYIKTTVATTGNVSGISCGTGNDPSTCQGTSTTNYAANTWYKVSSNTDITFKANGTLYARVNDGESYSSAETMTITKIDTTPPDLVLGSLKQTTKKTTIPFTASDSESGIDGTTCKYGTSTSYDKDGVIANNKCEMKVLTSNTKYYYILVTTNKAGLKKTVTGDTVSGVTTISFDMTKYPLDTSYSQYKNVQVTFNASNVSVPTYYIKTTVATTGNVSGISCGTGSDPSTCQGTSTTSYAANTWYKVPSSVKVNFTDNGTVYARVNDGEIYSSAETFTVTNIDKTPPLVELGSATTTSSISIPIKASDPESGLKSLTCVYGTSTSYGTTASISNNICQLQNLSSGTKYYYKVTAINNAGRITEVKGETTTGISSIDIGLTQYPTSTSYAQYKTTSIKFTATSISTPTYYIKTTIATTGSLAGVPCGTSNDPSTCQGTSTTNYAANTWYKVTGNTNVKFTSNGTVYARINDGKIYSSAETMTITKIDTTAPNLTLGTAATTTSTIVFDVRASDLESGIASTVCKYGTSTNYGYTGEIKNNKCIIKNNVVSGTTYYYQVTTTNNAGLTTTKTGSIKTGITSISFAKTRYPTNTKYAQYQTITTTFTAKNVTTPTYYVKTTVATTSSIAGISCGTNTDPSTCQGTSTTSYAANTWYKVTGNPSIKFTSSGTLYARVNDGEKFTSAETYTITEVIDPTPPNLSVTASSTTNSILLKITASDSESGIKSTTCEYGTSTSYGSKGTIQNGVCVATGLSQNTLYYYRVITTNGSGLSTTKTGSIKTLSIEGKITISPTPTTWSKSKTVKISVTNQTSGTTLQYRMVSGTTVKKDWTSISNGGTATINWTATTSNPTYIYARLYDGTNTTSPASATVTTNDADNPICTNTITDYTLSSVTVNMNCSDVGSGINKYYYSIDGASYIESTSKTYKFNGLHVSTIKLKVTDNVGNQTVYTLSESEKNTFYSNIHNLLNTKYTNMVNNQFLTSHPVGSIYMTTSSDENTIAKMASKYGGTWEVYAKGRTIMGYDSSNSSFSKVEGTGGSATTTLSTGNLPSHTHSISHTHTVPQTTITEGAHTHTTGSGTASYSFSVSASGSHNHGFAQGARDAMAIDTPKPPADVQRTLPYSWGYEYLTNSGWWHGWNKRLSSKTTSAGDHTHTVSGSATIPALSIGSSGSHSHTVPAMTTSAASTETSGATGSGTAFSRLSPYVTVYIYKRVS